MKARSITTNGWLLQKVPLANDDCLLTFLTDDLGKIKVFGSKLQRSKKKAAELDYFRWLELELTRPKNSLKLGKVRALNDYSPYLKGYEPLQFGFDALSFTAQFCPEEEAMPDVVQLLHEVWTLQSLPLKVVEIYFYTKLLWFSGVLPRFDSVRSAIYVHPVTLMFTLETQSGALALSNEQRQVLEWFRRSEAGLLVDTYEKFSEHDLAILQAFLIAVIKNH
jgi:recombinational DNA repair protein (RecF pathway)